MTKLYSFQAAWSHNYLGPEAIAQGFTCPRTHPQYQCCSTQGHPHADGCLGPGCCTLCCCACRRWKTTFLCYLSCLCAVSPWTHQSLDQGWSSAGVWASPSLQAHIHGPYVLRWKLSLRRACLYLPANDEIRWENALLVLAFCKVWQRHREGSASLHSCRCLGTLRAGRELSTEHH